MVRSPNPVLVPLKRPSKTKSLTLAVQIRIVQHCKNGYLMGLLVEETKACTGRLCCITSIYSRVARFKPVDTLEVAQAAL